MFKKLQNRKRRSLFQRSKNTVGRDRIANVETLEDRRLLAITYHNNDQPILGTQNASAIVTVPPAADVMLGIGGGFTDTTALTVTVDNLSDLAGPFTVTPDVTQPVTPLSNPNTTLNSTFYSVPLGNISDPTQFRVSVLGGTSTDINFFAFSAKGVYQNAPSFTTTSFDPSTPVNSTVTTPSIDPGDLFIDAGYVLDRLNVPMTVTPGAGQTQLHNQQQNVFNSVPQEVVTGFGSFHGVAATGPLSNSWTFNPVAEASAHVGVEWNACTNIEEGCQGLSLEGTKYEDLNGNGVRDPGEPPMQGVVLGLYEAVPTTISERITFTQPNTPPLGSIGTNVVDATAPHFVYTATTGSHIIQNNRLFSDPAPDVPTSPLTIRRNDNGLFTFDEYDIGAFDIPVVTDNIDVEFIGLMNGAQVFQFVTENGDVDAASTNVPSGFSGIANAIDTLEIRYVNDVIGDVSGLDNIDLTVVDFVQQAIDQNTLLPVPNEITDANGNYSFVADLPAGMYIIKELLNQTDTNGDGIYDNLQGLVTSNPLSGQIKVTVAPGDMLMGLDFGNLVLGSIHGRKFHDENANGLNEADPADPALPGVQFKLRLKIGETINPNSNTISDVFELIGTQTTDSHGMFWFTGLRPGEYEVLELPNPAKPEASTPNPIRVTIQSRDEVAWVAGSRAPNGDVILPDPRVMGNVDLWDQANNAPGQDGLISPADVAYEVDLLALKVVTTIDTRLEFGNFAKIKVAGFKYEDLNGDGDFSGDPALANVKFQLTGTDGMGNAVNMTTTTDANGMFMFLVKPGTNYQVMELPAALQDINGDSISDALQGLITPDTVARSLGTLKSMQPDVDAGDWGDYVLGSIHGRKFHDQDADGFNDKDPADPVLPGVQYKLRLKTGETINPNSNSINEIFQLIGTETTDSHGMFWFTGLHPGEYDLMELPNPAHPESSTPSTFRITIESRDEYAWTFNRCGTMEENEVCDQVPDPRVMGNVDLWHVSNNAPGQDGVVTQEDVDYEIALLALKDLTEVDRRLEFGNYINGKIHGYKFEDLNGDGDQDAGEPGLANVKFVLVGTDGLGNPVNVMTTTDANGEFWFMPVTPSPTSYVVAELPASQQDINGDGIRDDLQGLITPDTAKRFVSVLSGDVKDAGDWGDYVLGSIHGRKFHDLNANGINDSEPALQGVQFKLQRKIGETINPNTGSINEIFDDPSIQTSDSHGMFWFTGLVPGEYEIMELPNTLKPEASTPGTFRIIVQSRDEVAWVAGSRGPNGDVNLPDPRVMGTIDIWDLGNNVPGQDGVVTVEDVNYEVDLLALKDVTPFDVRLQFGNFAKIKVSGFKYEDLNGDGDFTGDPALANVKFVLTGFDGMGNAVNMTTTTDSNGMFMFAVKPGTNYQVMELPAAQQDINGDLISDALQGLITPDTVARPLGTLVSMQPDVDAGDWGDYVLGSIHGRKFHDQDADGINDADPADPVLPGVRYKLRLKTGETINPNTGSINEIFQLIGTETTDSHGMFWFTGLHPGEYEIMELPNMAHPENSTPDIIRITIESRDEYAWVANECDEQWEEGGCDGHGYITLPDPRVMGNVDLWHVANNAPGQDGIITDEDAHYELELLALKDLYEVDTRLEFGNYINGSVHGYKFEDLNGDGDQDAGEPALANVKFFLKGIDGKGNPVGMMTTTDANGMFWFMPVTPGTYTVSELPANQQDINSDGIKDNLQGLITDSHVEAIIVSSGDNTDVGKWADYVLGSIHGIKFHDQNANGINEADPADPALPGVQFKLRLKTGETINPNTGSINEIFQLIGTETSDSHGMFWFTGLHPGEYEIMELPNTLKPEASTPGTFRIIIQSRDEVAWVAGTRDTNGDVILPDPRVMGNVDLWSLEINKPGQDGVITVEDVSYEVDLLALKDVTPFDARLEFGNFAKIKVSGFKYEDLNGDGDFMGDPGLANVDFQLTGTDGMGNAVNMTATTDSNGMFMFAVKPGTNYQVMELPAAQQDINGDNISDALQGLITPDTAPRTIGTLVSMQPDVDAGDWGDYVLGSIHGRKFHDQDADGHNDYPGDPVLPGVQYKLRLKTGETINPNTGSVNEIFQLIGTETTDSHGMFWFTGLHPGEYEIMELPNTAHPENSTPDIFRITIESRQEYAWCQVYDVNGSEGGEGGNKGKHGCYGPEPRVMGNVDLWHVANNAPGQDGIITEEDAEYETALLDLKDLTPVDTRLQFGNYINGSIHGYKFEDLNGDGDQDPGEPALKDVKFVLTGTDGLGNPVSITTSTDANGEFWFMPVTPSPTDYTVAELPASQQDINGDGIADNLQGLVVDTTPRNISVLSGDVEDVGDWGNYVLGSIHGLKFHDENANGINEAEPADPPLQGVQFKLRLKTGETINPNTGSVNEIFQLISTQTTDSHGMFWFTGLHPGEYEIMELPNTLKPEASTPGTFRIIVESRDEYAWVAGTRAPNGDVVIPDPRVMGNVDLWHKANNAPGQDLLITVEDVSYEVDLLALKDVTEFDTRLQFGNFAKIKVVGFKYEDLDGDGRQDAGTEVDVNNNGVLDPGEDLDFDYHLDDTAEVGMAGIMFRVSGIDGKGNAVSMTTTSDANGMFMFSLIPGTGYQVTELPANQQDVQPDNIAENLQGLFTPDTAPRNVGTLVSMQPDHNAGKWGNYYLGSIHGYKYADLDNDGWKDSNEKDFPGVVFKIKKKIGESINPNTGSITEHFQPMGSETTDSHGRFWFTGLHPGEYVVEEAPGMTDINHNGIWDDQEGLIPSTQTWFRTFVHSREEYVHEANGMFMAQDLTDLNGNPPPDGQITHADLLYGWELLKEKTEINVGYDLMFGNFIKASHIIGKKVQDITGAPAPNIPIKLIDGISGNTVAISTSDSNGVYKFCGIMPGLYIISEDMGAPGMTDTILMPAMPIAVNVGNLTHVVWDSSVVGEDLCPSLLPMVYTEVVNSQLRLVNKIEGSIHGVKVHGDTGVGVPNIPFQLKNMFGTVIATQNTDANGEFWFTDLVPNNIYIVQEVATPAVLQIASPVAIVLNSGEEHVAYTGQANLGPGQYEVVDPVKWYFENTFEGSIHGKAKQTNGTPATGYVINLSGPGGPLSIATNANGEYWFEDLAPGNYTVSAVGVNPINVSILSGEEEMAMAGQAVLDPGQFATINPSLMFTVPTNLAPQVTNLRFGSSSWVSSFKNHIDPALGLGYSIQTGAAQAKPLPWVNINQIIVSFSEHVVGSGLLGALAPGDFALVGVNTQFSPIAISSINYDPVNFRATLNLASNLPTDRYRFGVNDTAVNDGTGQDLDGEWTDNVSAFASGNGAQGGDFLFLFNVSRADFTRSANGGVDVLDMNALGMAFGTQPGNLNYNAFVDSNGDGGIDVFDMNNLGLNFGNTLPAGTPGIPAVAAIDRIFERSLTESFKDTKDDGIDSFASDVIMGKKQRKARGAFLA